MTTASAGKFVAGMIPAALTHTVKRVPVSGQDGGGEPTFGGGQSKIPCFVDGSTRRVLTPQGTEVRMDFEVIFLPGQTITVGDKLQEAKLDDGTVLFADARVYVTDVITHPRHGIVARTASCKTGV